MSDGLTQVLAEAQRHGWIGQGPLDEQLRHAGAFTQLLGGGPAVIFDLGSGGGLPALPCALALPETRWVLIESQQRRADHLASAVRRLDLGDRVEVLHARAEDVGRDPARRGTADAVTSRSFGPPAVVAECAAPLLRVGGRLLVSEPPGGADRWPAEDLDELALGAAEMCDVDDLRFTAMTQVAPCSERYPRRPGAIERSPLW
jgi:16S rRNA (guanine527-N7)-methyltransferase